MKIFTFDPERCTGCRLCELVCSFKKHRVFSRQLSDIKVETREDLALNVPMKCMQCDDPPCIRACCTRALSQEEKTGAILIESDRCILCKACIVACPFGSISLIGGSDTLRISVCDLCSGQPECIDMCRSGAISYVDETDINRKKRELTFLRVVNLK
jgi:Fe-S-cluster-containing hydrogenase component 2